MSGPEPLLRVRGLTKSFGALDVLKDISLDIHPGEVVSVIGASGSGKSTFLRCINVLERPDAGRLDFDRFRFDFRQGSGAEPRPAELKALRARIGMVFQSYNLWPHMTVLENVVEAPVRVRRMAPAEARDLAMTLLARIGLGEKRDTYPARLSGGQQQRVAIVRALAMQPQLMLFDEVTSALDPELVGEVLALMADLAAEGMTMLLVTHEIGFAREVSTRTIFFEEGRVGEDGPPSQVLRDPRSPRLRQFLSRILHEGLAHGGDRGGPAGDAAARAAS